MRLFARASLALGVIIAGVAVDGRHASAVSLLAGMGGPAGFGILSQGRNDDGFSSELNMPFTIDFFGTNFNTFFINNNGNITFGGGVSNFTPIPFPNAPRPMVAPYWGDVDTRCGTCGEVYVGGGTDINGNDFVAATWDNVGFFSSNSSRTNSFQAILRERPDTGPGNFDIDFRYERLEWTTGNASGGSGGLGGTEAQAGFDAGNGPASPPSDFFTLPGSQTPQVLDLQNTSNVSAATPGLWTFAIRNGALPDGSTPSNPLLPVVNIDGEFDFDFNVQLGQQVFIDPVIAVGYDYVVNSGPNFASVLVPAALANGDADFTLDLGASGLFALTAGAVFDLTLIDPLGFSAFSILDISVAEALDPSDPLAFITGLTFVGSGQVSMTQSPITVNTGGGQGVPEPSSGLLLLAGLGLVFTLRRRRATTTPV